MTRVSLDKASPAVKKFAQSLVGEPGGVEVELNGEVLFRAVPAKMLSDEEKQRKFDRAWKLLEKTRARNRDVPVSVINREIREAVKEVRRKSKQ